MFTTTRVLQQDCVVPKYENEVLLIVIIIIVTTSSGSSKNYECSPSSCYFCCPGENVKIEHDDRL